MKQLAAIAVMVFLSSPIAAADLTTTLDNYTSGDLSIEQVQARPEVGQGDATVNLKLNEMYHGNNVPQDYIVAQNWCRRAAEQGDASAQYQLGLLYDRGWGVQEDPAVAIMWYRMAARQGHAIAQFTLGVMYRNGRGVSQDNTEAAKWYQKAADQGVVRALINLRFIYPSD